VAPQYCVYTTVAIWPEPSAIQVGLRARRYQPPACVLAAVAGQRLTISVQGQISSPVLDSIKGNGNGVFVVLNSYGGINTQNHYWT
jgi:hypothetical protein